MTAGYLTGLALSTLASAAIYSLGYLQGHREHRNDASASEEEQ